MRKYLDAPRRMLYRGKIKEAIERLGLRPYIANVYWKVLLSVSDDTVTRTVAGVSASSYTMTAHEFNRFTDETFKGEIEVMREMLEDIERDDVFYDIGANVGLHACFVASAIREGKGEVAAFEPHPKSVARLRENIALNDAECSVHECALSDSDGTAVLEIPDDEPGAVGNVAESSDSEADQIEIDLVHGDDLVSSRKIRPPTVVKIDVDGGEVSVLRGLRDTLSKESCRKVYCEVHPEAIKEYRMEEADVYDLLHQCGFETERFDMEHDMRENAYYLIGKI